MVPKLKRENLDLVCGMIIGDGHLAFNQKRGKNARLNVFHCPQQKEYLEWKFNLLKDTGFHVGMKFRPTDRYPQYVLWTGAHPWFTAMRSRLYEFRNTPGKTRKRITKKLLDKFTIRTLAVWFFDDGYNAHDHNLVHLSTDKYSFEEQKLICEWIYKLTGVWFKIYRRKECYYLATYHEAHKFLDAIIPHCPDVECMKYKIRKFEYTRIPKGGTDLTGISNRKNT